MRLISLLLYGFFIIMPVYLLETLVMPELNNLQSVYAHADETASRIADGR